MILQNNINNYNPVQWISRELSSIHSLVCILGSVLYLGNFIDLTIWSYFINLTIYYCIQDIYIVTVHNKYFNNLFEIIIHHIILIIFCFNYRIFNNLLAMGLLSESSSIFLNQTWMLHQMKKNNNKYFNTICIIILICFFLFRIINFSYIFYLTYNYPILIIYKIFFFIILIINVLWFNQLVSKFNTLK